MKETKPTVESIKNKLEKLKTYYATMHDHFLTCDDAYDGNLKIPVPQGYEKYVPATAKAQVDVAVDHHVTTRPIVTIPRAKDTVKQQSLADTLEKYYQCFLNYNAANNSLPPAREAAKQLALYGMCVLKGPLYDKRYNDNASWRQGFPFVYRAVNPEFVYCDPAVFWRTGDGCVIETSRRTVGEVMALYPNFKTDHTLYDEVDWLEYWSCGWRAYLCDNKMVVGPLRNAYGLVPYEIGFSGMGRLTGKPEDLAVGLIYPIIEALRLEATLKTAIAAVVATHAFPRLISDVDVSQVQWSHGPAGVTTIPKDANLREMYQAKVPGDLYGFINLLTNDIEKATFNKAVRGEAPQSADASGYLQSILVGEGRLRFGQSIATLNVVLGNMLSKLAYLTETLVGEPISIWGSTGKGAYEETFDPADINGFYTVNVSMEGTPPEENDRRSMLGLKQFQAGTIPLDYLLEEFYKVQDSSGMIKRLFVEKVMQQPAVLEALQNAALGDWGMRDFIDQIKKQQAQAMSQPPIPPQNMMGQQVSPVPNQSEMMNADLTNRQALAQATGQPLQEAPVG